MNDQWQWCRQNYELEEAFQEEKVRLEKETQALAEQLQAVLSDKYVPQTDFDADTPIDKILKILQTFIGVSILSFCLHLQIKCCIAAMLDLSVCLLLVLHNLLVMGCLRQYL